MTFASAGPPAMSDEPLRGQKTTPPVRRWTPLAVLLILGAGAYFLGLHKYLSLNVLAENHAYFKAFVADNIIFGLMLFATVYVVVVALSLPGATALSIAGGMIFGWMISAPVTVFAATLGAAIVFSVVKTSLGAVIAERAGPFVKRLSGGFAKDAFNYLLFLRLVPAFPFFAVNAVAGLCGVGFKPFVLATFIGIIPGSIVFAYLGAGLDSVIAAQLEANEACIAQKGAENCAFEIDPSSLVTPQLLIGFAALGVIALVPVIIKRLRKG